MTQGDVNREYYASKSSGRADYWRLMAAPRFRMRTFLGLLADVRPASIVELGCGSGLLLQEIKRAFPAARLCGMDFSESMIESDRVADPSIDWRVADLDERREFPSGIAASFDAVIASEIIEHLDHPEALLRNALQLAKPGGGVLMLSTQSGKVYETERSVGHKRHFSAAEMRGALSSSGWEPIRVWNAGFPFHDMAKFFANISPERTMRAYSGKPYGVSQRLVCAILRAAYMLNSKTRGAQLFAIARRA